MMPLWLFTLGKTLTDKAQLSIPFLRLISNLLFTIVPCLIGMFFARKYPRLKTSLIRITKPLVITLIVSFLVITLIAKYQYIQYTFFIRFVFIFKLISLFLQHTQVDYLATMGGRTTRALVWFRSGRISCLGF